MKARIPYFLTVVFFLCAVVLSVHGPVSGIEVPAGKYRQVKVVTGVEEGVGTVSWSPDGKRFAFIQKGVTIYDTVTGRQRRHEIGGACYLFWGGTDEVFVVSRESGRKIAYTIDADSLLTRKIDIDREPDAIFPAKGSHKLVVLSSRIRAHALWTDVSYSLSVYDTKTRTTKTLYETAGRLPVRNEDVDYLSGWIQPGINPVDTVTLTMEHVKPPVLPPYLKIGTVDYITGKVRESGRIDHRRLSVPGSWSPDGRRFAFADERGRLKIFDLAEGRVGEEERDSSPPGAYPSWNPKGSQIFFGGYIMSPDGKKREEIFPKSPESIGYWSPDGTKLAIVADRTLWLMEGFNPSLTPPDRTLDGSVVRKIVLLKELLSEGLITESEYEERRNLLLIDRGKDKGEE